jgi:squalene cyclase
MKRTLALCLLASALTSCVSPAPEPLAPLPPAEPTHVYHTRTRTVYVPVSPRPRYNPDTAEGFRAVEKPASYSQ